VRGESPVQISHPPELIVIPLVAAIVNGALRYRFSSITVPRALLFLLNRIPLSIFLSGHPPASTGVPTLLPS
jgi:hypothetical protein